MDLKVLNDVLNALMEVRSEENQELAGNIMGIFYDHWVPKGYEIIYDPKYRNWTVAEMTLENGVGWATVNGERCLVLLKYYEGFGTINEAQRPRKK